MWDFRQALCILTLLFSFSCNASQAYTYEQTKSIARQIWANHRETVYCGCKFDKYLKVDPKSCGYQPEDQKRGKRVEWEHIVPVSWFGKQRPCWQQKICQSQNGLPYQGRQCCEQTDPAFKKMYTDLHNIIPVIGEVNAARRNFRFEEGDLATLPTYHHCEIAINPQTRSVVPKESIKGLIARAHLYMAKNYQFKLSKQQQKLFRKWHQAYPPTPWEKEWNALVLSYQGTDNEYISQYDGSQHDH